MEKTTTKIHPFNTMAMTHLFDKAIPDNVKEMYKVMGGKKYSEMYKHITASNDEKFEGIIKTYNLFFEAVVSELN